MNKSETIGNLAKALSIVQSKLTPAVKDSKNPFFKSNYADLNSVWDACRRLLTENGLSVAQVNQAAENGVIVETVLMHESGEWISGEIFLPLVKNDPQGVGSAITYGRRYGLAAIVGIVADEDDDGNHASGKTQKAEQKQETVKQDTSLKQRIQNAQKAIRDLGGTVETFDFSKPEAEQQEELNALTDQYKRLKQTKGAK